MSKSWKELTSTDEKLEWLHDAVTSLIDTSNANAAARSQQMNGLAALIGGMQAQMKNIFRELQKIQGRTAG